MLNFTQTVNSDLILYTHSSSIDEAGPLRIFSDSKRPKKDLHDLEKDGGTLDDDEDDEEEELEEGEELEGEKSEVRQKEATTEKESSKDKDDASEVAESEEESTTQKSAHTTKKVDLYWQSTAFTAPHK